MEIEYLDHIPEACKDEAAFIYLKSLHEKLAPVLGRDIKALTLIRRSLVPNQCIVAMSNDKLVGILGIQNKQRGYLNPTLKMICEIYGNISGFLRFIGLCLLDHTVGSSEWYIDGIAICEEYRGKGIGSELIEIFEKTATKNGIRKVTLEVIDTNPRAKYLYERLGYREVSREYISPLNRVIPFSFDFAIKMEKLIDYSHQLSAKSEDNNHRTSSYQDKTEK